MLRKNMCRLGLHKWTPYYPLDCTDDNCAHEACWYCPAERAS